MVIPGAANLARAWRVSTGLAADLTGAARGRSSRSSSYVAARRLHELTSGRSSPLLHAAYRHLPGWVDAVPSHERTHLRKRHHEACVQLDRDGLTMLEPVFTADQISELRAVAEAIPGRATTAHGATICTYRDRPADTTGILVDRDLLWARREVQHLLASTLPAELATACFGSRAVQHFPSLVWSLPSTSGDGELERRMLARRFHCDYDGLRGLRIHVYLTDVDDGAAPMLYVRGSHRPGALPGRIRRRHGDDLPEAVVHEHFGADAVASITGPAGTTFATNSHGLHRATGARTGERLFLVLPVQAGSFAGAYSRPRRVPIADADFGAALAAGRPDLRLYRAGDPVVPGRVPIATLA